MISVGRMAEKYHMLPSEVRDRATTYDLMISDVLASYDSYQQQKQSGKLTDPAVMGYDQETLQEMMDKTRGK